MWHDASVKAQRRWLMAHSSWGSDHQEVTSSNQLMNLMLQATHFALKHRCRSTRWGNGTVSCFHCYDRSMLAKSILLPQKILMRDARWKHKEKTRKQKYALHQVCYCALEENESLKHFFSVAHPSHDNRKRNEKGNCNLIAVVHFHITLYYYIPHTQLSLSPTHIVSLREGLNESSCYDFSSLTFWFHFPSIVGVNAAASSNSTQENVLTNTLARFTAVV